MSRRRSSHSLPRRLLYTALLPVVVVLLTEVFAWALYAFTFDGVFSYSAAGEAREALASERLRDGGVLFRNVQIPWRRAHSFHPFVGYVRNPEELADGYGEEFKTGEHGFLRNHPPPEPADEDTVVVGLFGASFAAMFFQDAQEALVAELSKSPHFAGRRFQFHCLSIGGYKQPQQLMALNYQLVLGQRFDLILNIDGFNEVCLYPAAMRRLNMFPAYPRNWQHLTGGARDFISQTNEKVARWRQERKLMARRIQRSSWRFLVTVNLVWKLRDRSLESSLLEAQELAASPPVDAGLSYEQTGPPRRFEDTGPMLEELIGLWSRGSIQMRDLAEAHGARYFHFLQPNQYVPDSKPMGDAERAVAIETKPHYKAHVRTGYPLLQSAGEELRAAGVEFFDLTGVFQDVEEPIYIDSCCHINETGNEIVARQIAARILATSPEDEN